MLIYYLLTYLRTDFLETAVKLKKTVQSKNIQICSVILTIFWIQRKQNMGIRICMCPAKIVQFYSCIGHVISAKCYDRYIIYEQCVNVMYCICHGSTKYLCFPQILCLFLSHIMDELNIFAHFIFKAFKHKKCVFSIVFSLII